MAKDEQIKKALDELLAERKDEDETLSRLQTPREYIERLMDRIR